MDGVAGTVRKRRELKRRNTDDAVDRVRRKRLPWVKEAGLNGCVSPEGKTAAAYLTDAVREHRDRGKHLKTEWWSEF